jgi:phosphatidylinositol 4-kinase
MQAGWDLVSVIVKANDDVRQEVFAMQLISLFRRIFQAEAVPLWLRPYKILAISSSRGLIETIHNAVSLDRLKKSPGFNCLRDHFEKSFLVNGSKALEEAQLNFIYSMAAYSLVSYLLQIKDRHNGNIMLTSTGHVLHIDFGFLLGIAPGGGMSVETAPFKLTTEMVNIMGGVNSSGYAFFIKLICSGFLVARKYHSKFVTMVKMGMRSSKYPCFAGNPAAATALKARFKLELNDQELENFVRKMVQESLDHWGTQKYDQFQQMTNGIEP